MKQNNSTPFDEEEYLEGDEIPIQEDRYSHNVASTMREKRILRDDKSCKGRFLCVLASLITFIFKLQDFAIVFLTVLTTAAVSLGFSVSTGDAHLSMFYAVCAGTLVGSIFILGKMCIRAKMGKAWVDVEVDSSNFVLILFILVFLACSIVLIIQLDKNCVGKPSLCTLQDVITFTN